MQFHPVKIVFGKQLSHELRHARTSHQWLTIRVILQHTSNSDLKYGLQAERTILCALHVCPSHASVTSVKLFSSRRCLNDETILDWKSFHFKKNCCCSADMVLTEKNKIKSYHTKYKHNAKQVPCQYKMRVDEIGNTHTFSQICFSHYNFIKPTPKKN
jgi:hypothetical protein